MRAILGLLALAMILAACGATPTTTTPPPAGEGTAPTTGEAAPAAETGPITIAWLPNESGADLIDARDAISEVISETLGRPVEHRTTTDYIIAVEAMANNNAHLGFFGAEGYVQANERNPSVVPLVIPSGADGTVETAVYYSWLAVRRGEEGEYRNGEGFAIDNIQGKRFSFVSNSSTSGFRVPSANIVSHFGAQPQWQNLTTDDLLEGGPNDFFADVQFGGSHQGTAVNLLTNRVDVASFCDACVANYVTLIEGEANQPGAVYRVNDDADEPFNQFPGAEFVLISSVPVLNAPFVANGTLLTADEIQRLQDAFTSDEVANNDEIFATPERIESGFRPLFRKTDAERFLVVEDSFFDPIRALR